MSITPCDVMLLLPGTDAAGLSYKIYPLLLLLLLLASRSPRQLRYIYPDSAQNNWCARAYWRSIKAAPDCLNKFIEDAILSMRPVLQLSSTIIYYTASFIGDYFRDIITSCSFLSSSSYFSNIYLFHSERFFLHPSADPVSVYACPTRIWIYTAHYDGVDTCMCMYVRLCVCVFVCFVYVCVYVCVYNNMYKTSF